ncbi:MAG: YceI family protein [Pseudomonadota bacterium]
MRSVIPLLALTLVACSSPDSAPNEPEAVLDFEPNYAVVMEESALRFSGTQEGSPFEGSFGEFDADIRFDADDLDSSQVRVSIPLASIDAGSGDRNSTLPDAVWFDSRNFPTAVFESDDISRDGDGYVANGTLSLKGAEAPVPLFFTLEEDARGRTVMRGDATLDRTDWNVGASPWDTGEYVGHAVELDVVVVAEDVR